MPIKVVLHAFEKSTNRLIKMVVLHPTGAGSTDEERFTVLYATEKPFTYGRALLAFTEGKQTISSLDYKVIGADLHFHGKQRYIDLRPVPETICWKRVRIFATSYIKGATSFKGEAIPEGKSAVTRPSWLDTSTNSRDVGNRSYNRSSKRVSIAVLETNCKQFAKST